MPRYAVFGHTITLANRMEFAGPFGMVHISEPTKKWVNLNWIACLTDSLTRIDRYLKKDKYYFVESNVQHLFDFPTYIVTKLYEEYHEDHLVVENNLNMSGGLFKSPTNSPTHEANKPVLDRNMTVNGLRQPNDRYDASDFTRFKNMGNKTMRNEITVPAIQISKSDKSSRILTRDQNLGKYRDM